MHAINSWRRIDTRARDLTGLARYEQIELALLSHHVICPGSDLPDEVLFEVGVGSVVDPVVVVGGDPSGQALAGQLVAEHAEGGQGVVVLSLGGGEALAVDGDGQGRRPGGGVVLDVQGYRPPDGAQSGFPEVVRVLDVVPPELEEMLTGGGKGGDDAVAGIDAVELVEVFAEDVLSGEPEELVSFVVDFGNDLGRGIERALGGGASAQKDATE